MSCFPGSLIVTDDFRWRRPAYLDDATADLIVQRTDPVPLPSRTRILAFRWENGEAGKSEGCAAVRELIRPDQRG